MLGKIKKLNALRSSRFKILMIAGALAVGGIELQTASVTAATPTDIVKRATTAVKQTTTVTTKRFTQKIVSAVVAAAPANAKIKNPITTTTKPKIAKANTTIVKAKPGSTTATTKRPVRSVTVSRGAARTTVEATIREVGAAYWSNQAELDALVWINKHECVTPGVVSRGGCQGLFQLANPPKWMVLGDAASETKAGCEYIKRRYKTPLKAKAYWLKHHWY